MTKYNLQRDLFLNGVRYRQRADGTEIPDHITQNGVPMKVRLANDKPPADDEIVLPKGTTLWKEGQTPFQRRDRRIITDAPAKTEPMALSELPKHQQAQEAAHSGEKLKK